MAKISLISLGCEKNTVNSEQMLWLLTQAGHETTDPEYSDVVILNTCGFIDSAKTEAIEHILSLARLRDGGHDFKIIVAGCLAQRHPDEILSELPEVDGILGTGSYSEINRVVDEVLSGEKPKLLGEIDGPVPDVPRLVTTPKWYTYLKIAEGCDNRCAYCVIPSIRGRYRSRTMDEVLDEARGLARSGTKELILIAQDVTRYGRDLRDGSSLSELLRRLCGIEGIEWVRLHYLYPDEITDELLEVIAGEAKILKYFDLPIQHVNDAILRSMNRRTTKSELETLLGKIRASAPDAVLRTSIICGLPGEGEEEFRELCDFLSRHRFQRAGFFAFSPQEGTKAASMPCQVPEETALSRVEILQRLQERIMYEYNLSRLNTEINVLCEGYDPDRGVYFGRSGADSPGIDEQVRFRSRKKVPEGSFVRVLAKELSEGEILGERI